MNFPLFSSLLRSSKRSLLWWPVVLILVFSMYLSLWDSMRDMLEAEANMMNDLPAAMQKAFSADLITEAGGYVHAVAFTMIGWVLCTIAAISWAQSSLGKLESRGELAQYLAVGMSRWSAFWQASAASVLRVLWLSAICFLTVLMWNGPGNLHLHIGYLALESLAFTVLLVATTLVALAGGAFFGSAGAAIGFGSAFAVGGYFFRAISGQGELWEWLDDFSPMSWAFRSTPILHGWSLELGWGLAALSGVSVCLWIASLLVFTQRDLFG